ncbi:MAG: hypothetical protein ACI4WH_02155 [Oscillospiraceae bacterium]
MDSMYFLKKLYKTSKSAVIIVDTSNTIFWSTNLGLVSSSPEEMKSEDAVNFFGKRPCDLYPGQGVANIHGTQYTYNVKTYSDRTTEFVIIEIRTESTTSDFIRSDSINKFSSLTSCSLQKNTSSIVSIVNDAYTNKSKISLDKYNSVLDSVRQILSTNRNITNLKEIKDQVQVTFADKVSFSNTIKGFADDCNNLLKSKNIKTTVECVEDVKCYINENILYNLCISLLNKLIAMSGGYVSDITLDLEMYSENIAEFTMLLEGNNKEPVISNQEALQEINQRGCVFGTDLFFIKEFCESFHCEAIQRTNSDEHKFAITIKIPRCESSGVMLFKCEDVQPDYVDKFSKLSIGLSEIYTLLD